MLIIRPGRSGALSHGLVTGRLKGRLPYDDSHYLFDTGPGVIAELDLSSGEISHECDEIGPDYIVLERSVKFEGVRTGLETRLRTGETDCSTE